VSAPDPAAERRTPSLPAALHAVDLGDVRGRPLLTAILVAALAWSLLQVEWSGDLVRARGTSVLLEVARGLLQPDLSAPVVGATLRAAWATLVYALAGISLALAVGLPLGVIASGVLFGRRIRPGLVAATRALLAALRAVHELVWAWLFVAALGLSPIAAVLALALPYAGILGRIYADLLNDVASAPLAALTAAGADRAELLLYGHLPMAAPDMAAYTFYRFECALRSSAIMGFVGLGGLGFQIQVALADLRWGAVATAILALVALIAAVEAWSGVVRRALAPTVP
jgi:phosphonate transport system permease protein